MKTQESEITAREVARQIERVVASPIFARAARSQRFLRYLVAAATAEPPQTVKEYVIATEVFDRGADYDPSIDATVRVEAGRLRTRLREYYGDQGRTDPLLIELPKGAYRVVLTIRGELEQRSTEAHTVATAASAPNTLDVQSPPMEEFPAGEEASSGEEPSSAPYRVLDPSQGRRARSWKAARFPRRYALLLLGTVILVWTAIWKFTTPKRHQPAIRSIAVLPLKNLSGDPGQDYLADGTTDEVITELARIPDLRVVSWNSVMQEKDTTKSLQTIAHELGADVLVEGSVSRSDETIRINAQLIDTRTDNHLWASSFDGPASETMALENRAAVEIVNHMRAEVRPNAPAARLSPLPVSISPEARQAYLRGKNYFDKRQGRASAEEYQRAIELNPAYAPAYAGLAVALESEALLGEDTSERVIPEAMAAAERSLELDPDNGDALIARGSIETNFLWQWEAARRDLTRGVLLSPNDSFGHMMLAVYLDALGSPEAAVKQMQEAVEIDPLSFFMARHYGSALFFARRYDEALRQFEYARKMHPEAANVVDAWISAAYEKEGRYSDAVRYDLMQAKEDDRRTDVRELLATYQAEGWQVYWALRLERLRSERNSDPCRDYLEGLDAIRAGRHEEAIRALRRATEQHCYWMNTARTNPLLDDIRSDHAFRNIMASLHLPLAGQS